MKVFNLIPRGFLRFYILKSLRTEGLHGYNLMKKIEEETGFWKPTPGSIYPTLKSLKQMGLIEETKSGDRKNIYKITKQGKEFAEKFEQSLEDVNKRFAKMVAEILKMDEKEVATMFDQMKNFHKSSNLLSVIFETKSLLMKLSRSEKAVDAKKILEDTNKKLRKLVEE